MKNNLGYALFPGDYVVKMEVHDHYNGHEFLAKSNLITELLVNNITVAKLKRHVEEHWMDGYPEDVLIYDKEVEIVNPIKYDVNNIITYKVSDGYRNSDEELVTGEYLFPYECLIELGSQIKKEGIDFWHYSKELGFTKYDKKKKAKK